MAERALSKKTSQEMLEEALKAREKFLKEQPHLQSFQDEIDRILEKTVGFENRMSVLAFMIQIKLYELRDSIAKLSPAPLKGQWFFNDAKAENADEIPDCSKDSGCYLN